MLVALLSCFTESIDLTDSEIFEPLIGLCLECKKDMAAAPSGSDRYSLVPLSAVPEGVKIGDEYLPVPAGSRVQVNEVRFVRGFDGSYLSVFGELSSNQIDLPKVNLRALFDREWRTQVTWAIKDNEPITIAPAELPINWQYVAICEREQVPEQVLGPTF
jgi:hypothetical protein